MKTLAALLAMIEAGQPVILNGEHIATKAQLEAAYPAAAEAHEIAQAATPQALVTGIAELKAAPIEGAVTRADLDALRDQILGTTVPKAEYDALAARIQAEYVPIAEANVLVARNSAQADLIDALTKSPESLALLDDAGIAAVAAFEGVKPGKTREDTAKAILAKRGA